MKKYLLLLTVLSFLFSTNFLSADEFHYPAKNPVLSITFPNDWKIETEEEQLHATPKDESLYLGGLALDDIEDVDDAMEAIDKIVAEFVDDFKAEEPGEMEINGIEITFIEGIGKDEDGEKIEVSTAVFSPDDGETVFVLFYFGYPEATKKHEKALVKIIESIKAK